MRKLMFLGGANHQLNAIHNAKINNTHTICCDNLKANPGHKVAHESFIISTTQRFEILNLAKRLKLDGIMTYGSDVSLRSLGLVCDELNLQGITENQAILFGDKQKFRKFLNENNLQKTNFVELSLNDFRTENEILKLIKDHDIFYPLIVKPNDRSGGAGITKCSQDKEVYTAIKKAQKESLSDSVIIEEFIESAGIQICGDGFLKDGEIIFIGLGNNFFHKQSFGPFAEVFPNIENIDKKQIKEKIKKIFRLADYSSGPFNFDIIRKPNGEIFIIELTPRLGGNFLSEAIHRAYGVDLIKENILFSLNQSTFEDFSFKQSEKYYFNLMLHLKKPLPKIEGKTNFLKNTPIHIEMYDNENINFDSNETMSNFLGNALFQFNDYESVLDFVNYLYNEDFVY